MTALGLCYLHGPSLVVVTGDYFLVPVYRLLNAGSSLVVEHRLQGIQTSAAVAHGLSSCGSQSSVWQTAGALGIFSKCVRVSHSVVSDSLRPHGL